MRPRALWLLAAFLLLAAACASPAGDTTSTTATPPAAETDFPVTVEAANGEVTVTVRPTRIVSTSATATEMLFAIGAGSQVVAVDRFSTYPPEAPVTDLDEFSPNVEAIVGFDPDLVVMSTDVDDIVASLETVAVPVLVLPPASTLDDVYRQIDQLGLATDHAAEAGSLVEQMQTEVEGFVADLPEMPEALTYYHELDDTFFTATSGTFIGEVYGLFGLVNIADAAEGEYPQLSSEFIVEQDPDLIFLANASCCGESADTVAARPGLASLSAVRAGSVVALDSDIASRWGPRIVEFMRVVRDAVVDRAADGS